MLDKYLLRIESSDKAGRDQKSCGLVVLKLYRVSG